MDYTYSRVTVWDNVGGAVRLARNTRIDVTDPATGAADPGLKQNGQPVSWVTTDSDGHATFTSTLAEARLVGPRGFWQDVTSTTAILTTATNIATDTATNVATQVATTVARGNSNVSLDTDGVPYFDLSAPGTQSMQVDTDGVPYFL